MQTGCNVTADMSARFGNEVRYIKSQNNIMHPFSAEDICAIVSAVPAGKVTTYGDVAALAGSPSHARLVGRILAAIGMDSDVPCHRVVNAQGRPAPHWHRQRPLLESEGVVFNQNGLIDMRRFRWQPASAED